MTEIIIGCVVVLGIILLAVVLINNKFQFAIVKIEEAENSIDTLLKKKAELLERAAPAVIKELKLEDYLTDLSDISPEKCNSFERNDRLKKCYNTYLKTLDENEKLTKSETLSSISDDFYPVVKGVERIIEIINCFSIGEDEENFIFRTLSQGDFKVPSNNTLLSITLPGKLRDWYKKLKEVVNKNNE